jgi:DNA-binding CsgD family transcriptional regulator
MPAVVLPPEKPVFRLGAFGLTERELEVARHLLAGAEFNEVAARLGVSENTLKSHVRYIYAKTGARCRHDLIPAALRAEELSEA